MILFVFLIDFFPHGCCFVLFRWLCECLKQEAINEMPIDTMEWMDLSDENTMFSPALIERGLTPWECSNCPWWIDYPLGVVPKQELQLHASKFKLYFLIDILLILNRL